MFKIEKIAGGWFSKARTELQEVSNAYYNEDAFLRRFAIDPLNFNQSLGVQMSKIDLLKYRAEILQRHLKLNIFKSRSLDKEVEKISRFYNSDKNVSAFSHFIINNYRREQSFNYIAWKVMEELGARKMSLQDLSKAYIEELCFTILPSHKTMLHLLGKNYESLYSFIEFVQVDEDGLKENLVSISDIPFIPDVNGQTPIHKTLKSNNTRVTDCLLHCLKDAKFDHHSRYLVNIYSELIDKVPSSIAQYFDCRL